MKRTALFVVISLILGGQTAMAQGDFPSTAHGSFDGTAYANANPESLTAPLPPIPGKPSATPAHQVSVVSQPAKMVPFKTPQATQEASPIIAVSPEKVAPAPEDALDASESSGDKVQLFVAPTETPVITVEEPQTYVIEQSDGSILVVHDSNCGCQHCGIGKGKLRGIIQRGAAMAKPGLLGKLKHGRGCVDGTCQDFVIDNSQFPQEFVETRHGVSFDQSCDTCSDFPASPAARPRRRGNCVYSTVGVSGLLFDSNHGNNRDFSTNAAGDILASDDAVNDVLPGVDVFVGRRRSSGRGWEARYFGLYPSEESIQIGNNATTLLPGLSQLGTSVTGFGPTSTLTGPSTADLFNATDTHVLTRSTEINNFELNLLKNGRPRLRACATEFLVGFRYFHFAETLLYEAVNTGVNPTSLGYFSSTENHLLGFQFGARSDYQLRKRLMLHLGGKIGAFNNNIKSRQRVDYRMADGTIVNPIVAGGTLGGQRFDIGTEDDVKSILGEVELSLSLQVSESARIRCGYRALGATDIAFSSNQIADDFSDATGLLTPNADDDLVLQGGFFGLDFAY